MRVFAEICDDFREIGRRNEIARHATIALANIKREKIRSFTMKIKKKTLALSIVTYGSKCWVHKTSDIKKIASFEL